MLKADKNEQFRQNHKNHKSSNEEPQAKENKWVLQLVQLLNFVVLNLAFGF